jgi:protein-disulfide isomerase
MILSLGAALLSLGLGGPALPQSHAQDKEELNTLREEVESLKKGHRALQREMEEIKRLLTRQRRGRNPVQNVQLMLDIGKDPFKGDPKAKVTLVEFSDYQCPYCARHVLKTMPLLEKRYIRTGQVKYVFKDFPIERIHPQAFKAHEAANCANEQGQYWAFHDRLFANQRAFAPQELLAHGKALGLNPDRFSQCLADGKYAAKIRKDLAAGRKAGVNGTPMFFIGFTKPNSPELKAIRMVWGAQPYPIFKQQTSPRPNAAHPSITSAPIWAPPLALCGRIRPFKNLENLT